MAREKKGAPTRHFLELLCSGLCKVFGLMNRWPLVGVVMYWKKQGGAGGVSVGGKEEGLHRDELKIVLAVVPSAEGCCSFCFFWVSWF